MLYFMLNHIMRELPTRVAWHISKLVGFKLDLIYELGACKEQSAAHGHWGHI